MSLNDSMLHKLHACFVLLFDHKSCQRSYTLADCSLAIIVRESHRSFRASSYVVLAMLVMELRATRCAACAGAWLCLFGALHAFAALTQNEEASAGLAQ